MAQLSDSQAVVLGAACGRPDRSIYPLTTKLPGAAAAKVLGSLLKKGLIKEVQAKRGDTVWREDKKKGRLTLRATPEAFEALDIEPNKDNKEEADAATTDSVHINNLASSDHPAAKANANSWNAIPAVKRAAARANSKQAQLIAMLKSREGATIEEIVKTFDWQPHTARGVIAGALKKKLGLNVQSEKVERRGRVYRIGPG